MARTMNTEIKLANIPSMTVGRLVELLSKSYISLLQKGAPLKTMPSVMLWGPPGVGKSQAVRQMAEEIERETGKKTCVTDVRLLLFNPIDLRGIPTANADKTLAVWLKPQIFQMDESDETVNILFLDEISAAPQSVQAAAYQITLDRVVGEHRLPDNCIVIAAGNRTTDKSVAFKMPKALANRLMHIEVEVNFDSWKEWAIRSGVNPKVVGFLDFKRDALMHFDAASEELAFATPRSWEMLSNVLNHVEPEIDEAFSLAAGLVGMGAAVEFHTWCKVYENLPSIRDIFAGKTAKVPRRPDELYALISAMTAYAGEHREDLEEIRNSIVYANKLPPDFSVALMRDYMYIEKDYVKKLLSIPEFSRWMQTKGSLLNGSI
ncbi:MAG: AAA family ATPase [Lachnospiraceae bacterium]|nr:AAA family ATPase [Lachnospiraceae bacterium]